jgi:hypothetical protein
MKSRGTSQLRHKQEIGTPRKTPLVSQCALERGRVSANDIAAAVGSAEAAVAIIGAIDRGSPAQEVGNSVSDDRIEIDSEAVSLRLRRARVHRLPEVETLVWITAKRRDFRPCAMQQVVRHLYSCQVSTGSHPETLSVSRTRQDDLR